MSSLRFNPPPGWPAPPPGWVPPTGWTPDPAWPTPPEGWPLWISDDPVVGPGEEADPPSSSGGGLGSAPADTELDNSALLEEIQTLRAENRRLLAGHAAGSAGLPTAALDDAQVLQEVGIYRYHHPLESAAAYQHRLRELEEDITRLIRSGEAIVKAEDFSLNNSLSQGRRLSTDLSRLMLRAYNAEAENAVRALRAGNVQTALRRVERSKDAIAKLGALMEMRISDEYHQVRVQEIELTADWLAKKQEEREAAREERARLREEARVQRELEEERARLDKERLHLTNTLEALRLQGRDDEELHARLTQIDKAIEDNDFRAANIRAGYIYVISNQGAFGKGVVKIGLTRRLEPQERIAELSGASVPFKFDIHALFFSEDAVSLELDLHRHFADRALNRANARKEFFFASPAEVRDVLLSRVGNILEFTETAEATEFRQSLSSWPKSRQSTDR